jgi:hypothetical protein
MTAATPAEGIGAYTPDEATCASLPIVENLLGTITRITPLKSGNYACATDIAVLIVPAWFQTDYQLRPGERFGGCWQETVNPETGEGFTAFIGQVYGRRVNVKHTDDKPNLHS